MDTLTDKKFWEEYWANHRYQKISDDVFYSSLIKDKKGNGKRFIELGGFPGYACVYFKKKFGYDVSLFDFYISQKIVDRVEEINGLPAGTIHCIENDIFIHDIKPEYDFVISLGLIEHFENTQQIIQKHYEFLKEGGELMITLPNFRGLNGWVQRTFDPENYKVHNIQSMNPALLKQIVDRLGMKMTSSFYFGKPMIWLETKHGLGNAILRKCIKVVNLCLSMLPVKGKLFAPFIVLQANK